MGFPEKEDGQSAFWSGKPCSILFLERMESVMENLIVLGTGNALATHCYNTCFAIDDGSEAVLVDAGGGNGILSRLEQAEVNPARIHHLIVTHEHCDHLLGVVWMVRKNWYSYPKR